MKKGKKSRLRASAILGELRAQWFSGNVEIPHWCPWNTHTNKQTNKQTNKYISSQRQILALKLIIFAEEWEYLTRQRLWLVVYNIESKIRFYEKRPRHLFLLVSEWGLRKFALN